MKSIEQAKDVINTAESQLRRLVADAANLGDYEAVVTLADWARKLAELGNGQAPKSIAPSGNGHARSTSSVQKATKAKPAEAKRKTTKRSAKNSYPKFIRSTNDLVKIGWSKKSKEEYRHRAPHSALTLLAETISKAGSDGRLVDAHDLIPLEDPSASSEVPSYQVYLCLAWLRDGGLIEQQGRQGYTVPNVSELPAAVEDKWVKMSLE